MRLKKVAISPEEKKKKKKKNKQKRHGTLRAAINHHRRFVSSFPRTPLYRRLQVHYIVYIVKKRDFFARHH